LTEKTLNLAGYKCKALLHRSEGVPVVFLHGYSYTREIWQQLGITDLLVEKRIPFMALDMPYGRKTECTPKTTDVAVNVSVARQAVTQTFGSQTPIVVGASLGGNIALHYAQQFPVKGLLLVAPASALEDSLTGSYSKFGFPVRVVWGTEDNIISGEEMRTLVDKLPHGKLVTYQDAGHSAYNHQPDRFKRDLLELYAAAE
jgi:pimeloyl-ACP methyl ester carboxylesterase